MSASGQRESYGHPLPWSDEARRAGVFGLDARRYCLDCGAVSDVVLEEFVPPLRDPKRAWEADVSGGARGELKSECAECRSRNLTAALPDDVITACQKCGVGHFVLSGGGLT